MAYVSLHELASFVESADPMPGNSWNTMIAYTGRSNLPDEILKQLIRYLASNFGYDPQNHTVHINIQSLETQRLIHLLVFNADGRKNETLSLIHSLLRTRILPAARGFYIIGNVPPQENFNEARVRLHTYLQQHGGPETIEHPSQDMIAFIQQHGGPETVEHPSRNMIAFIPQHNQQAATIPVPTRLFIGGYFGGLNSSKIETIIRYAAKVLLEQPTPNFHVEIKLRDRDGFVCFYVANKTEEVFVINLIKRLDGIRVKYDDEKFYFRKNPVSNQEAKHLPGEHFFHFEIGRHTSRQQVATGGGVAGGGAAAAVETPAPNVTTAQHQQPNRRKQSALAAAFLYTSSASK